jgi:H+/Cl- antiporter ClcA
VLPVLTLAWSIPFKYDYLDDIMHRFGVVTMFEVNWAISVVLVVAGVLLTHTTPIASGSGIPQLIAYLYNGKKLDKDLLSPRMVIVKMIGVVCGLTGGLVIGREGPAIAMGAGIADSTNRLINKTIRVVTGRKVPFDGAVKSNIVMMGATAGFASAFRAPIGGLLYCVEELATHWDIKSHMTVGAQTFFVAMVAAFLTQTFITFLSGGAGLEFSSIVIFSPDDADANKGTGFEYLDIPVFIILAVICGVLSGVKTHMCNYVRGFPYRTATRRTLPNILVCAVVVSTITAIIFSLGPLMYVYCKPDEDTDDHRRLSPGGGGRKFVQYTCPEGEHSQLASLSLTGEEAVIRHLLSRDGEEFDIKTLLIFFVMYFPLTVIVKILPIPMGSFVPNLLLGALTGRIVGLTAQTILPNHLISSSGVYALVGAGALLSAWTRTMTAIVVTLLEVSGDIGLSKPLILSGIIARSIATRIAHHSFSHDLFYTLTDPHNATGGSILHPNDWRKPPKDGKARANSLPGDLDETIPRKLITSNNHGIPDKDDSDDSDDDEDVPKYRVRVPSMDENCEGMEELILSKKDIELIRKERADGDDVDSELCNIILSRRTSSSSILGTSKI